MVDLPMLPWKSAVLQIQIVDKLTNSSCIHINFLNKGKKVNFNIPIPINIPYNEQEIIYLLYIEGCEYRSNLDISNLFTT